MLEIEIPTTLMEVFSLKAWGINHHGFYSNFEIIFNCMRLLVYLCFVRSQGVVLFGSVQSFSFSFWRSGYNGFGTFEHQFFVVDDYGEKLGIN